MKDKISTFNKLNTKQKLIYIKDYYKWYIFIAIFTVYVFINLINFWIINPPPKIVNRIVVFEKNINQKNILKLKNFLNEKIMKNDKKNVIEVEGLDLNAPRALDEKLKVMIAAGDIDLIISTKKRLKYYEKFDILKNLNDVVSIKNYKLNFLPIFNKKSEKSLFLGDGKIGIISNTKNLELTKKVFISIINYYK